MPEENIEAKTEDYRIYIQEGEEPPSKFEIYGYDSITEFLKDYRESKRKARKSRIMVKYSPLEEQYTV